MSELRLVREQGGSTGERSQVIERQQVAKLSTTSENANL
jgi:hypothetical protein